MNLQMTPQIQRATLNGMEGELSTLIVGCDNKNTLEAAAPLWDAWWEAGGNAFDSAFVYGKGLHEQVLGQWMRSRGVAEEAKVIVKGAHTPNCLPDKIAEQLEISLDRLGLDHAPVYIMHRDNLDVPVGEFVDALNALVNKGLLGALGGSNWTVERFKEASVYADAHGLRRLSILNNNLSLAVMEKPVWDGCITSNTASMLRFLRDSKATHISWSSQARGYFIEQGQRTELPNDTAPDTCFASVDNEERRRRAGVLAEQRGVLTHQIATAWVLGQGFPSMALIGPRTIEELAKTLPALTVQLSEAECNWLNLERDAL
jgi:aryl-alcohol dehydrogenase-like predicted oxidoreductase